MRRTRNLYVICTNMVFDGEENSVEWMRHKAAIEKGKNYMRELRGRGQMCAQFCGLFALRMAISPLETGPKGEGQLPLPIPIPFGKAQNRPKCSNIIPRPPIPFLVLAAISIFSFCRFAAVFALSAFPPIVCVPSAPSLKSGTKMQQIPLIRIQIYSNGNKCERNKHKNIQIWSQKWMDII